MGSTKRSEAAYHWGRESSEILPRKRIRLDPQDVATGFPKPFGDIGGVRGQVRAFREDQDTEHAIGDGQPSVAQDPGIGEVIVVDQTERDLTALQPLPDLHEGGNDPPSPR